MWGKNGAEIRQWFYPHFISYFGNYFNSQVELSNVFDVMVRYL
ncbi:hypothetical protein ACIN8IBEIGE_120186 [Acinetobacter sp. 8I-beige]|nr:hypothetical protein ACIN8IBEIGE_120186 [Acinetobacter sp. 8I-beige]